MEGSSPERKLLTIKEAASRINVSRQTIYSWIREGKIVPVYTPGGRVRISEDQLTTQAPINISQDTTTDFPVHDISHLVPARIEWMGSKEKYWFSRSEPYWYWESPSDEFLFKAGRKDTGENWAEKIASELCSVLGLPHADYDLAIFDHSRGVISPKFVMPGDSLLHGNEILSQYNPEYDTTKRYHHSKHTIKAVFDAITGKNVKPPLDWMHCELTSAADVFVGYLMLDAWIANTDRHHENWGLIVKPEDSNFYLAPTFDHASSLGRNVTDAERRERLTTKDHVFGDVAHFVRRARSAFYLDESDSQSLSTVEAFEKAANIRPTAARYWLDRIGLFPASNAEGILQKVPQEEMSNVAKEFTFQILDLNRDRLLATRV